MRRAAAVGRTPRPARSNSDTPKNASRPLRCSDTAGWLRRRACAARPTPPASSTARNSSRRCSVRPGFGIGFSRCDVLKRRICPMSSEERGCGTQSTGDHDVAPLPRRARWSGHRSRGARGPDQAPTPAPTSQVIVAHAATLAWAPGPPSLPPGAEFVLLEGNPAEAVPLTFRLRFPANYRIPPHWHSVIEHVTVLAGTLNVGMGEVATYSGGTALNAGSFAAMPAKMV